MLLISIFSHTIHCHLSSLVKGKKTLLKNENLTYLAFIISIFILLTILFYFIFNSIINEKFLLYRSYSYFLFLLIPLYILGSYLSTINLLQENYIKSFSFELFPSISVIISVLFLNGPILNKLFFGLIFGSFLGIIFLSSRLKIYDINGFVSNFYKDSIYYAKNFFPIFITYSAFFIMPFFESFFAQNLITGHLSSMGYSYKVFIFLTGPIFLILSKLSTVFLSNNNISTQEIKNRFLTLLFFATVTGSFLTLLCYFFSREIIELIYYRGKFSSNALDASSVALLYYSYSIPFYFISALLVVQYTLRNNLKVMFWASFISLIFYFVVNSYFFEILSIARLCLMQTMFYFSFILLSSVFYKFSRN